MKYGLLDFDLTVNWYWNNTWNRRALLNIGDAAEYMVVEQLYRSVGISDDEMVRLSIPELKTYRGEHLTVALNIALDSYVGYNEILDHLSPDITPIFLGISLTSTVLNSEQLACLQRYSPVGCRDQRTYDFLSEAGVSCYLNGCTASVLEIPAVPCDPAVNDKILFIDVPLGVAAHVPVQIKERAVFLNQELYCTEEEFGNAILPSEWAKQVMSYYMRGYKGIITSRFHGAVLALACNVPVAITLEKYTFRFSWLKNYCPLYTEETYSQIDWELSAHDYRRASELVKKIAQARIGGDVVQNKDLAEITTIQKVNVCCEETNQVLYYHRVWSEILRTWDTAEEIEFGFWGINDNAMILQRLISEKYPRARFVALYDMFQPVEYQGHVAKHPREISERADQSNFYVIVTAYLASRVAGDIFKEAGFPQERAFLCQREFIDKSDL